MLWPTILPSVSTYFVALFEWLSDKNKDSWLIQDYSEPEYLLGGSEALSCICLQTGKHMSRPVNLLVPAYFCGQSLRYLRDMKVNLIFDELTDKLAPDYESVTAALVENNIDIFVHVHYFGSVSSQQQSRFFCNQFNIILVEDCAHIIHPSVSAQWVGDFLIFSPSKHFPISAGGVLYSKTSSNYCTVERSVRFPYFWHLKRLSRRYLLSSNPKLKSNREIVWSANHMTASFSGLSSMEVSMLHVSTRIVNDLIRSRRQNWHKLLNMLSEFDDWTALVSIKERDAPYLLGMCCSDVSIADIRYSRIIQNKCPIMMWPDLPVELETNISIYLNDIERTKSTIFFFLHEQIDIDMYLYKIKSALNEQ